MPNRLLPPPLISGSTRCRRWITAEALHAGQDRVGRLRLGPIDKAADYAERRVLSCRIGQG